MKKFTVLSQLAGLVLAAYSLQCSGLAFTNKTDFLTALPGTAGVLNFDGLSAGTDLSGVTLTVSGGSGTGVVFPSSVSDGQGTNFLLMIAADNLTSSSPNSLGVKDSGNYNAISGGTNIDLGMTNLVNAFGLSFITPDDMVDGDIKLVIGNQTASLLTNDRTLVGNVSGDNYYAYFLGIIADSGFNSASIRYGTGAEGAFLYNADDLTVAVAATKLPEPPTVLLMLGGALVASLIQRKR